MTNNDSLHIMFLRALSSHPTLLQCPLCNEIGRSNDEFMSHFQSHPMRQQVIHLAQGFSTLGITSTLVLPPERLKRSTRAERVMPQITPPPPLPSSSPPPQRSYPIRGNNDGESVNASSIGIDLNEIPSESTSSQDVPIQNTFSGSHLTNTDDETNDELDLNLRL
ncbi:hypothetical protein H5410_059797 [Solanum commersonii]|uniref:Uncharacterized protein n=1 Tax=Solanum commersonii TaxID=4109 RepID=A0A9J5W3Q7_SOLCO|nr:hypothetical protein H5410_059797 [Solanum commersonii]